MPRALQCVLVLRSSNKETGCAVSVRAVSWNQSAPLDITDWEGAVMLETGIAVLVAFMVGLGVGYHVREQALHKHRIERRLAS